MITAKLIMAALAILIGYLCSFALGMHWAINRSKIYKSVRYWKQHALKESHRVRMLRAAYVPYFDADVGQWRDPHTGEFVGSDKIIPILEDEEKELTELLATTKKDKCPGQ